MHAVARPVIGCHICKVLVCTPRGARYLQQRPSGLALKQHTRADGQRRFHPTICQAAQAVPSMETLRSKPYFDELQRAVEAVQLASTLCQKVQRQLKAGQQKTKEDQSPVTVADYGAQALVAWSLKQSTESTICMVAEEDSDDLREPSGEAMADSITSLVNETLPSGNSLTRAEVLDYIDVGRSPGGSEGRNWVLDPIDGTRGFVGLRQYAVCLGLLDKGKVVLGVLGCPNLPAAPLGDEASSATSAEHAGEPGVGCLFAAVRGAGAFVAPLSGEGQWQAIRCDGEPAADQVRFSESFETGHSNHGFSKALAEQLGISRPPLRIDSQAKYGVLARGDAHVNLRFPKADYREKIWDHCAGQVIVEEAGLVISDAEGTPLDFGRGRWLDLSKGIITAPPALHKKVLGAIADLSSQGRGP